jgi:hypothetical protein
VAVNRPNVELHIEELVLHGFAAGGSRAIAAAIEAELGRMLTANGLPRAFAGSTSIDTLDGGSFEARGDAPPQAMGNDIARAVHGGFEQ